MKYWVVNNKIYVDLDDVVSWADNNFISAWPARFWMDWQRRALHKEMSCQDSGHHLTS